MLMMTVNGVEGLFMGFGERHGLQNIEGEGSKKIYSGFYHGNHFKIEACFDYGAWSYELLEYVENNANADIGDELENLITFINDKNIQNKFYSSSFYQGRAS